MPNFWKARQKSIIPCAAAEAQKTNRFAMVHIGITALLMIKIKAQQKVKLLAIR
jgi:hypothetical protein